VNCCSAINADTGRFFSRLAGFNRLRFRFFGFERTQRQLMEGIQRAGLDGAELLEVGCGTGGLHQALLRAGAARATGVDLSAGMLATARAEAEAEGLEERADYRQGDFVQIADAVPEADATILDKVVCCYPDWEVLLDRSLAKTRRVYALTYPRDRAVTRAGILLVSLGLDLLGCSYRPYLHPPEAIRARISAQGFQRVYTALTTGWHTEVHVRDAWKGARG
jgi:SAM-dependent methyltransferase